MKKETIKDVALIVLYVLMGIAIAGFVFYSIWDRVSPLVKWTFTDKLEKGVMIYVQRIDESEYFAESNSHAPIEEAHTKIIGIRNNGKMSYYMDGLAFGQETHDFELCRVYVGEENIIHSFDEDTVYIVYIPQEAEISPYGRIIKAIAAVIVLPVIIIVIVIRVKKKNSRNASS